MGLPVILAENVFDLGTPTATSTDPAPEYNVLNVRDRRTYTFWKGSSAADQDITVDPMSSAIAANTITIVGHNLGSIGAEVTIRLKVSGSFVTVSGPHVVPNDRLFFVAFTNGLASFGWQVRLTSMSAAPRIAVILLGQKVIFPRYPLTGFDPTNESVVSESSDSRLGHFLGSIVRFKEIELNPQFDLLAPSWIDGSFKPLWDDHLSQMKPFVWAWDYQGHPSEIFLVRLSQGARLAMPYDPVRRSLSLAMRGVRET